MTIESQNQIDAIKNNLIAVNEELKQIYSVEKLMENDDSLSDSLALSCLAQAATNLNYAILLFVQLQKVHESKREFDDYDE